MFDLRNHQTDLKIDAMFFTTTDERLQVLGEEFEEKKKAKSGVNDNLDKPTDQEKNSADLRSLLNSLNSSRRSYLDADTVMICNPNAMSY